MFSFLHTKAIQKIIAQFVEEAFATNKFILYISVQLSTKDWLLGSQYQLMLYLINKILIVVAAYVIESIQMDITMEFTSKVFTKCNYHNLLAAQNLISKSLPFPAMKTISATHAIRRSVVKAVFYVT